MKIIDINSRKLSTMIITFMLGTIQVCSAQTDQDAAMMQKNDLCSGFMYSYSSWGNYWEGIFKRDNQNLGIVSTQMIGVMGAYGISKKLNAGFNLPYVQTNATQGTLHGMKGIQDLSLWLKWQLMEQKWGKGKFSVYGLGGFSFPVSNYQADFLPLAIGVRSKTLSGRIILDYQKGSFFVTGVATYSYRNNITIDRNAYYTTSLHSTNEVEMPDVSYFSLRTGYRHPRFIAEAVVMNMTTLGGFDIRKNDMPFPSNKMNATTAGLNLKYTLKKIPWLSVTCGGNYTIAGRNVGQAATFDMGIYNVIDFTHTKSRGNEQAHSSSQKN